MDPSGPRVDSSLPPTGPAAWRGLPLDRRELARQHAPVQSGTRSGEDRPGRAPPGFSFGGKYKGKVLRRMTGAFPCGMQSPPNTRMQSHARTRTAPQSAREQERI